jgi:hypothetical protein
MSPAYLDERGTPQSPEDLKSHEFLVYDIRGGTAIRMQDEHGNERNPVILNSSIRHRFTNDWN